MADLDLDPETFRQAADQLDAAKDEVQGLLDQFTGALEEFADAFGGDTIGTLAGLAHQACTDGLTECFTTNIEELADYAQNLREMADVHETGDADIAAMFDQIGGEIGT
ncbi:WXG100 family type VII secretion target [Glycomyces paridis]|uniref:WXG100 family type VII secretion target n=1 Tax=Glycomyces paridis TaxID=2126555 RepID=A0A4S8PGA1_9ACTN|nr:type VII secretion target [Glycomyces paridis]THV29553.1 hypothetical protein E9998_08625 [Glycomyces paridis]